MEQSHELARTASFRRYGALLLANMALTSLAISNIESAEANAEDSRQAVTTDKTDWQLQWRERFNGDELSSRWEVTEQDETRGNRFMQYRPFNVRVKNGKVVITSRRHCTAPGEDMTLANAQATPCPEGTETHYSSGRIEEFPHSLTGDFNFVVEAKMPTGQARGEAWLNNIDSTPGSGNEGYCIEGETPLGELDLMESYGDDIARAAHHVHCDNGEFSSLARKKKFPKGWLKQIHTFAVVREGVQTTFYVDGEPLPIRGTKRKFADRPRDFKGITRQQFDAANGYNYGAIFSTHVFDGSQDGYLSRMPDPKKNFTPQRMKILDVRAYHKG